MKADPSPFQALVDLVARLDESKIAFSLQIVREGSVMVALVVPGERWEVEFMADGSIEVEVFRSSGDIEGSAALVRLFEQHG